MRDDLEEDFLRGISRIVAVAQHMDGQLVDARLNRHDQGIHGLQAARERIAQGGGIRFADLHDGWTPFTHAPPASWPGSRMGVSNHSRLAG